MSKAMNPLTSTSVLWHEAGRYTHTHLENKWIKKYISQHFFFTKEKKMCQVSGKHAKEFFILVFFFFFWVLICLWRFSTYHPNLAFSPSGMFSEYKAFGRSYVGTGLMVLSFSFGICLFQWCWAKQGWVFLKSTLDKLLKVCVLGPVQGLCFYSCLSDYGQI